MRTSMDRTGPAVDGQLLLPGAGMGWLGRQGRRLIPALRALGRP